LSCTINLTSAVLPAQFGTTTLTYTQAFSVNDLAGQPQTKIRLAQASVVLTVPPTSPNMGGHTMSSSPGTQPSQLVNNPAPGLLPAASAEARVAMSAAGILIPPAGITMYQATADKSGVSNTSTVLNAMARAELPAGQAIKAAVAVNPAVFSSHVAVSYLNTGAGWFFTGAQPVSGSMVESEPVVFTRAGTYRILILILPTNVSYRTSSLNGSPWVNLVMPRATLFSNPIPSSGLPQANQSM
jgi:hypothetical protein